MSGTQTSLFTASQNAALVPLAELTPGQEADFYALLVSKEELTTKDGKPYFRVAFRDAGREVRFPLWSDSSWSTACREQWSPGEFYKLRTQYRETNFGPQLEIRKIRPVAEEDYAEGFDPSMCLPQARFDPDKMFAELVAVVQESIPDSELAAFVLAILHQYQPQLLTLPAAKHNHHAQVGGWLEHVLSVTRTCVYLAEKYATLYPDLEPPLQPGLVVAGGVLHDIGKLRELQETPTGAEYTAAGTLIGHILQGRDILREMATVQPLAADTLLRLEHIIVAHQRLPEWGSPVPPMTPEALLVHYADDLDAKMQMFYTTLATDSTAGPFTSNRNPLRQHIYRGLEEAEQANLASQETQP